MEYLIGSNGIFVRAIRPEFQVVMPVGEYPPIVKGLAQITPHLTLTRKVPESLLVEVWRKSCIACPNEMLFHFVFEDDEWQINIPQQTASPAECTPIEGQPSSQQAAIEIHSHASGSAMPSPVDDADEGHCFRIFGVIGKVRSPNPQLHLRVGLFGHCWVVPVETVFEVGTEPFIDSVTPPRSFYTL